MFTETQSNKLEEKINYENTGGGGWCFYGYGYKEARRCLK
jgi:hypothetical protein